MHLVGLMRRDPPQLFKP